eukprot:TRINITY_DN10476_c0_g1_i3.p2 TRINITY_DN10476_c0_g1~~TRINITY_DN10476_c0_g1_i3.p2  ORF type:complete len:200 (-),score=34.08 TRINITY_DN10476_c0_g1_i3:433-1032(-)
MIIPKHIIIDEGDVEMALRNITNYKVDDILRKKSRQVEKIDERVLQLLDDMAETMYKENGAGLAAPQVGILKRIIVVDIGEGLIKLINPEIVEEEGSQQDIEGCLSVPDIIGEVIRPYKVKVKGLNELGKEVEIKATGFLARAFCHEIDHLNGILFIDKVIPETIKNTGIQIFLRLIQGGNTNAKAKKMEKSLQFARNQ